MADEQSTSVTLDQIKELIGGLKTELGEQIDAQVNKAVTGMGTKLAKSLEAKQSEFVGSLIEERLTKVLDSVLGETEPEGSAGDAPEKEPPEEGDPTAKLQAMLQKQTQQLEQRLTETTQQYEQRIEAMQKAVDDERLNTAKAQARTAALDPIRERLHNPDLAWAYLESKGATYDPAKGYGVPGQDEFENPTFTPLSSQIANLEKEAAYLFKSRPGTGTGAQPPTGSNGEGVGNSAYAANSKVTPDSRFDALKTSTDPLSDIVSGLEKAVNTQPQ